MSYANENLKSGWDMLTRKTKSGLGHAYVMLSGAEIKNLNVAIWDQNIINGSIFSFKRTTTKLEV